MGLSTRHYLFADDGLYRLSHRVMSGLDRGEYALPQYAGTRQRVASVTLQNENRTPVKILEASGSYYSFDANGNVDREALQHKVRQMINLLPGALGRDRTSTVVDIGHDVRRERFFREINGPGTPYIPTILGRVP
jgi:hypothetical protein